MQVETKLTETPLTRSEAAEYIRKNADPACCLDSICFDALMRWQIEDDGSVTQSVDGTWCYSRHALDGFIEIQGLMAQGVIKP